jgi:hypothetical protein
MAMCVVTVEAQTTTTILDQSRAQCLPSQWSTEQPWQLESFLFALSQIIMCEFCSTKTDGGHIPDIAAIHKALHTHPEKVCDWMTDMVSIGFNNPHDGVSLKQEVSLLLPLKVVPPPPSPRTTDTEDSSE